MNNIFEKKGRNRYHNFDFENVYFFQKRNKTTYINK